MGELTHQSLGTGTDKAIRRHPGRTFGPGGGGGGAGPARGRGGGVRRVFVGALAWHPRRGQPR
ncbi:hypothetical protein [Nocardia abscessus]|uniref:hypothetical protein n=1 Tax=Nocardia abscessus TaxID=120957 RepID=UPI002458D333|nr:hypothetical protein [Nocardia abscessus]